MSVNQKASAIEFGTYSSRQRKIKRRAASGFRFGPDAAAMAMDNTVNRGQPDTGAFKFVVVVKSLKRFK